MQKKINIKLLVFAFLSLAVMAAVFIFSCQPGDDSAELSLKVSDKVKDSGVSFLMRDIVIKKASPSDKEPSSAAGEDAKSENSFIISGRKWGHVYLYALLGLFLSLTSAEFFKSRRGGLAAAMGSALMICFLYACSDEFHQRFVDGRTGCMKDVLYDFVGFGTLSAFVFAVLVLKNVLIKGRKK